MTLTLWLLVCYVTSLLGLFASLIKERSRFIENIPLKSLFLGHKQLGLSYFLALCRYSICEKSENHDELKNKK